MLLTKYEHACFVVEEDNQVLVVDPGNFTTDFKVTDNITAIVITHEHPDHFDPNILAAIYDKNPNSILIALSSITSKMPDHKSRSIEPGQKLDVGPFHLEFFGGQHAQIHAGIPVIDNVGVLINEKLYYPGDSFVLPGRPVEVLALPVSAPWLKISETIDFLTAVKPKLAFPTHDAILSDFGKGIADRLASGSAQNIGTEYRRLGDTKTEI